MWYFAAYKYNGEYFTNADIYEALDLVFTAIFGVPCAQQVEVHKIFMVGFFRQTRLPTSNATAHLLETYSREAPQRSVLLSEAKQSRWSTLLKRYPRLSKLLFLIQDDTRKIEA